MKLGNGEGKKMIRYSHSPKSGPSLTMLFRLSTALFNGKTLMILIFMVFLFATTTIILQQQDKSYVRGNTKKSPTSIHDQKKPNCSI